MGFGWILAPHRRLHCQYLKCFEPEQFRLFQTSRWQARLIETFSLKKKYFS
jgi:hypothetical protein